MLNHNDQIDLLRKINQLHVHVCGTHKLNTCSMLICYLFPLFICLLYNFQPKPIDVQVITHHMQRYAVWFGPHLLRNKLYNVSLILISHHSAFHIN
jgi:hypothetical protein